jgi:hypothetical protein
MLNFEQVLDSELILLQVIDSEKLKSVVFCFENVVICSHDFLDWIYIFITYLIYLLLCLLIPHYQLAMIEPHQVEWVSYMTEGFDILPLRIVFEELILSSRQ